MLTQPNTTEQPQKFRSRVVMPDGDAQPEVIPLVLTLFGKKSYRYRLWQLSPYCRFCGRSLSRQQDATIDHMTPRSQGGGNQPWNLALCCEACNHVKGSRTPE